MKSLSTRSLDSTLLIISGLVVLGFVFVYSFLLLPNVTSAAAVSVTSLTATSTNVYVNTGFATTSRVTTGDDVNFQLTLDDTPLVDPEINIFLMGSTTTAGSATSWC